MSAAQKPLPTPTETSRPFWEGCRIGELRLQHCRECNGVQFPPRRHCATCLGTALVHEPASGHGRIRSWSVVRHPLGEAFAGEVPYPVALIELDEGPTMMATVRECPIESLAIGLRVRVVFEARSEDISVPCFRPL